MCCFELSNSVFVFFVELHSAIRTIGYAYFSKIVLHAESQIYSWPFIVCCLFDVVA